jgi:hypothetical protein
VAAPRRGELAGVPAGRRRCSAVWERGESKGASEIDSWGSCSAQARERSRAGPLVRALHGGVAVAAAGVVLEAAGVRGTAEELQREATGGGGGRPRRVGASARRSNGRESREGAGGRRCRWTAARSRAGRGKKGIRAILQFPKVPGTKL